MGQSGTKIWSKDFILLFIINNVLALGFQMLTPIVPKFSTSIGAGEGWLGLITACFAVAAFASRPFSGYACDRFNTNLIQRVSLGVMSLAYFAYCAIQAVPPLMLLRFLHGLIFGVNQTATSTILARVLPKEKLSSGIGIYSIGMVISMGISPGIGLWIVDISGYPMLFVTAGAITVVAFALTFLVSIRRPPMPADSAGSRAARAQGTFAREAAVPAAVSLLNCFLFGSISTFVILHGEARNVANIGLFFTVYAMALILVRVTFSRYSDRIPERRALYPCILLLCLSMVILWAAGSLAMFMAAAFIYGIGNGIAQPLLQSMALKSVGPERQGVANGTFFMGVDLGNGIGPILASAVAVGFGYGAAFLFMVIPGCIGILVLYISGRPKRPRPA